LTIPGQTKYGRVPPNRHGIQTIGVGCSWARLRGAEKITDEASRHLLTASHTIASITPRYYQEIAINRAVQTILQGQRRVLLTMATGTGKTVVAFQICWKLWSSRWNRTCEHRRPRILFLADRNVLIDDPKDKTFAPFGDARFKIEGDYSARLPPDRGSQVRS
jgi:type I restriction enzyme R subunit